MVYTLGESLLDIIISTMDNVVIRPGGAMLNTAISLGRSKVGVSLITEMGDDDTSKMITSFLHDNNVDSRFLHRYTNNNTSLALAYLDKEKKPSYTFIKNYPEIRKLANIPNFKEGDILLFGSLYSLDKDIRKSIFSIVSNASKKNVTVIYDPNIRNAHHLQDDELMRAVHENIKVADIIKGSDEDFINIFDTDDTLVQISELRKINNEALIIITQGANGVIADFNKQTIDFPAIKTKVISTIGAGDAFNAGIIFALSNLSSKNDNLLTNLETILKSGLKYSAEVCSSLDNYISSTP